MKSSFPFFLEERDFERFFGTFAKNNIAKKHWNKTNDLNNFLDRINTLPDNI